MTNTVGIRNCRAFVIQRNARRAIKRLQMDDRADGDRRGPGADELRQVPEMFSPVDHVCAVRFRCQLKSIGVI